MASVKKTTSLIHHPYRAPVDFEAPLTAVHKASTVFFPSVEAMKSRDWKDKSAYTYGLHGTPTTFTLEERLCAIEGGLHCLLVPSGLAAIAQVNLALLASGDEVLSPLLQPTRCAGFGRENFTCDALTTQLNQSQQVGKLHGDGAWCLQPNQAGGG